MPENIMIITPSHAETPETGRWLPTFGSPTWLVNMRLQEVWARLAFVQHVAWLYAYPVRML